MMWLLKIVGFLTGQGMAGIVSAALGHLQKMADTELAAFKSGTDADTARYGAYLDFMLENNRLKLAQNAWWGAKAIILIAGLPAAGHMAAVFLDSLVPPFGSWGIPKLPAPYDDYEQQIVLSFFLIAPAMPVASAFGAWLARKR